MINHFERVVIESSDASDQKSVEILLSFYRRNSMSLETLKTTRQSKTLFEPYDFLMIPFAIYSFSSLYLVIAFILKKKNLKAKTDKKTLVIFSISFIFSLIFTVCIVTDVRNEACRFEEIVASRIFSI